MRLWGRKEFRCASCGAKFDTQEKLAEHDKTHNAPMTVNQ